MRKLVIRLRLLLAALLSVCPVTVFADTVAPTSRTTRNVVVRAEPTTASASVGRLLPGEQATLIDAKPGWYQVRLADGTTGWVSKAWTDATKEVETSSALPSTASAEYRVHVIEVGTGLAVFVEGPDFTLLYDGGSQDDLADGADNRVVAYIHAVRPDLRRIDHLVLSHPHKDHLALLPDVFAAYQIGDVWDSGALNRTLGYCRFLRAVAAEPVCATMMRSPLAVSVRSPFPTPVAAALSASPVRP